MRKLALAVATLAAFLLPLTATSADAKPHHGHVVAHAIDWD